MLHLHWNNHMTDQVPVIKKPTHGTICMQLSLMHAQWSTHVNISDDWGIMGPCHAFLSCMLLSLYQNQCRVVSWILRDKPKWNFDNHAKIYSLKKMHFTMSSVKCEPYWSGRGILKWVRVSHVKIVERFMGRRPSMAKRLKVQNIAFSA